MEQLFRDQFYDFINTATTSGETSNPTWTREGTGVESLEMAFNPQKDTYKDITKRTAITTFKSYQISSSISGKRCFKGDDMYPYLKNLKDLAISSNTQYLEVDTTESVSTGTYKATRYDILITITSWLGEDAVLGYDIDYSNPIQGTVTLANGVPTFTPTASL